MTILECAHCSHTMQKIENEEFPTWKCFHCGYKAIEYEVGSGTYGWHKPDADRPRTGIHYLVITDSGKESAIMSNELSRMADKYAPRPWQADDLRSYIQLRAIQLRPSNWGDATPAQARTIAMYLDSAFEDSPTKRKDRLAVLEYLFERRFASSKGLTKAEAAIMMNWLTKSTPEIIVIEAQRCLEAYLIEHGQRSMFDENSD